MAKSGGFGVLLKITVSASLTTVAQLEDVEFPKQEAETVEVTTHDSTGGYAEFLKTGLFRLTKFTADLIWDDSVSTHAAIVTAFASTTSVAMSITTPGAGEAIAFQGLISALGRESKQKGALKCKVEITPTGQPTIT